MSLGPAIRTPYTDLTGCVVNHQFFDKCAQFEMRMIDCFEAYGMLRGKTKCAQLAEDLHECASKQKQFKRLMAMRVERHRQYLAGESKEHYAPPPKLDSY